MKSSIVELQENELAHVLLGLRLVQSLEAYAQDGYRMGALSEEQLLEILADDQMPAEGAQAVLMSTEAVDELCEKINFSREGSAIPAEVVALLKRYKELHDGLSEMVESGRLTQADIPDDYEWLVERMLVPIASHPGQAAID